MADTACRVPTGQRVFGGYKGGPTHRSARAQYRFCVGTSNGMSACTAIVHTADAPLRVPTQCPIKMVCFPPLSIT
jgi:hypothetical protein